jgi:MerR family copper efflux transcriptional regulator
MRPVAKIGLDFALGCNVYAVVVTLVQISELAAESGVPTSTLRYYERIGLVRPQGRSAGGYRLYDETAVERVAFIGRAKRLGMSLDDVAVLIEAWFAGECEPLQDQLRAFVGGRIGELRRQIADESAFEHQLERILTRLDSADALPERCSPDCGCDVDPGETFIAIGYCDDCDVPPVVACSLSQPDAAGRISDWRRLLSVAVRSERIGTQARFVFDPSASVSTELARLCAAETECCPFFEFGLDITAGAVVLTIDGPNDAADTFATFLVTTEPAVQRVGSSASDAR